MQVSLGVCLNGPERLTVFLTSETAEERSILESLQLNLGDNSCLVSDGFIHKTQQRRGLPDVEIEKDELHLSLSLAKPSFHRCGPK